MVQFLGRAAEAGVGEIIYLGDSFQYLHRDVEVLDHRPHRSDGSVEGRCAAKASESSRSKATGISFSTKRNWLRRSIGADRRYEFTPGRLRFRLDHGDLVNRRDFQYRFWSSISKSGVARLWARLAAKIHSGGDRPQHGEPPREDQQEVPLHEARLGPPKECGIGVGVGIDVLFWGHFHTYLGLPEGRAGGTDHSGLAREPDGRDGRAGRRVVPGRLRNGTV